MANADFINEIHSLLHGLSPSPAHPVPPERRSTPSGTQQATHILLSIFKKPLTWLEQKYDRETLLDSINAITIHQ